MLRGATISKWNCQTDGMTVFRAWPDVKTDPVSLSVEAEPTAMTVGRGTSTITKTRVKT